MEKTIKTCKLIRYLALPLSAIMFFMTCKSIGVVLASLLGMLSFVVFWIMVEKTMGRLVGDELIKELKKAIDSIGHLDSFIEVKTLSAGLLIRVYLVKAGNNIKLYNASFNNRLRNDGLGKYVWMMQVTDIPDLNVLDRVRAELDEKMIEFLKNERNNPLRRRKF
ncbi:MAG: hypothetical protein MJ145_01055 [Clostridia bacterium]|nr:hypothetical protein [Clostridia bacterium]